MSTEPASAEPSKHDAWFVLGYLRATLRANEKITPKDWAEALEAAEAEKKRQAP